MKKLCAIFSILLLLSFGGAFLAPGGKDYTEENRMEYLKEYTDWAARILPLAMQSCTEWTLTRYIYYSDTILVGTLVKAEEQFLPWEGHDPIRDVEYTVRVDEVWCGEVVGKTICFRARDALYMDGLFDHHIGNSYIFMCSSFPDGYYRGDAGIATIFPIQPSTGKLYPIDMGSGFDELDGKSPEYLRRKIQKMQTDVLKNGFDYEILSPCEKKLGPAFQPYQTAYETGRPVEFIPYVIQKLIEGPLSAYEGEPYYDALLTRVKKAYNSRKSRWGMTEGKLYSILEEMLPKLADKARKESK